MPTATKVRIYSIPVEVPDGTTVNPGGMFVSDRSDFTPAMLERFEAVKRAVVECCGQQGQTVSFERRMRELYA